MILNGLGGAVGKSKENNCFLLASIRKSEGGPLNSFATIQFWSLGGFQALKMRNMWRSIEIYNRLENGTDQKKRFETIDAFTWAWYVDEQIISQSHLSSGSWGQPWTFWSPSSLAIIIGAAFFPGQSPLDGQVIHLANSKSTRTQGAGL